MRTLRYAIILLLAVAAWFAYQHRLRLTAWAWHIKNHGTLSFGSYLVPVPSNWYVHDFGRADKLLFRVDRDPKDLPPGSFPVTIDVSDKPLSLDLNEWAARETADLQSNSSRILRHDLSFGDEKMVCLGTEFLPKTPATHEPPLAWYCRSSGRLELRVIASDPDMPEIWDILSRIHRAPT